MQVLIRPHQMRRIVMTKGFPANCTNAQCCLSVSIAIKTLLITLLLRQSGVCGLQMNLLYPRPAVMGLSMFQTLLLTVWCLWAADELVIYPSCSHGPLYVLLTSFTAFIIWSAASGIFRFLFVIHMWSLYSLVYGPCFLLGAMIQALDRQLSGSFLLLALGLLSIGDGLLKMFSFLPKPLPRPTPQPAPAPPPRPSSASCSYQPQFFYVPLRSDIIVPLDKYSDISPILCTTEGAMSSTSIRAAVDAVLSGISSGDNSEIVLGSFSDRFAPLHLPTAVSVGTSLISSSHEEDPKKNQLIPKTSSDSL